QSTFYEIVNTRLMGRKSTIISTNLSVEDLSRRYYQQVASRIEGEYQILLFFGQDIRKLKKERQ
ncbi:MAG: DNA replication protein DnaC, partial [Candidatus Faecousia sp.]|nr:DNA replication protein DnaC [Candidatus Faecousia sp.]